MAGHGTHPVADNSFPCSSERSTSPALQSELKDAIESDDESRRVPEFSGDLAGATESGPDACSVLVPYLLRREGDMRRKRGINPTDKENKRLRRLLRNRVSAQQARERKKAYLNDLEVRIGELEMKNSELEEMISTLQNENQMLRHILRNTTAGRERGSVDMNVKRDASS